MGEKQVNKLWERHRKLLLEVGNKLREFRLEEGLTQEKLAELSDISPEAISRIEHGKMNLSLTILAEIANNLKRNPADFFQREEVDWNRNHILSKLHKLIEKQDENTLKLLYNVTENFVGYRKTRDYPSSKE